MVRPRPVIELPLRCCEGVGFDGIVVDGGEDETALVG